MLGGLLGWLAGSVLRIRRAHVEQSMRAAGVAQPARQARAMYRSLGIAVFEFLWMALRGRGALAGVRIEHGSQTLWEQALAGGRGVVVAASHTGNWDLSACAIARDVELLVVTKRLSAAWLDRFWQSTRAKLGVRLTGAAGALGRAREMLRRGGAVAMMIDQAPAASHAIPVTFLGQPAHADRAPAAVAATAGAPIVVAASRRDRIRRARPPRAGGPDAPAAPRSRVDRRGHPPRDPRARALRPAAPRPVALDAPPVEAYARRAMQDPLVIAGRSFESRLIVGTGKYKDVAETERAIDASGAEIVTVALRRVDLSDRSSGSLMALLARRKWVVLPNTAGCHTADEAVRTLRLARELGVAELVKLEVIGDPKTLYPDNEQTLEAAKLLVKEGFVVLPYCIDDPIVCRKLEDLGCAAVMPLAAPIGSGLGIRNPHNLEIILEHAKVPVIVDAGVGTASDAAVAMELGCQGVLMNTAIAHARDPVLMAEAMREGVRAGRKAFLAGRMPRRRYANASSPTSGIIE